MQEQPSTSDRVVEAATSVVQTRGYNGFSYADIADMVGIRTSSLHHHFPAKGDLGRELAIRYRRAFGEALADIESETDDRIARLQRYAELYARQLSEHGRMCLCGMLAAEYQTLPDPMRTSVVSFLDQNCEWLSALLEAGRSERSLHFDGTAPAAARMIVGALEGAMLVSRPYADTEHFELIANRLIDDLTRPARPARARR